MDLDHSQFQIVKRHSLEFENFWYPITIFYSYDDLEKIERIFTYNGNIYSRKFILEEECGLTICDHTRDFIPGKYIVNNIADAIQTSRKTIILLSGSVNI